MLRIAISCLTPIYNYSTCPSTINPNHYLLAAEKLVPHSWGFVTVLLLHCVCTASNILAKAQDNEFQEAPTG